MFHLHRQDIKAVGCNRNRNSSWTYISIYIGSAPKKGLAGLSLLIYPLLRTGPIITMDMMMFYQLANHQDGSARLFAAFLGNLSW